LVRRGAVRNGVVDGGVFQGPALRAAGSDAAQALEGAHRRQHRVPLLLEPGDQGRTVRTPRPAPAAPAPPVSFSTSQSLPPGYGGPDERARSSVPSKVPTIPFLLPYEGMWLSARSRPARSSLFFSLDWIINVCEIHWYFSRARKLEGATRRMRLELMTGQG
jgi:hypothetical protein